MIVGIYGPNAIGKTAFLNSYMCMHKGGGRYTKVRYAFADINTDYHWDKLQGRWVNSNYKTREPWLWTNESKQNHLEDMVADDIVMWVIESARYFNGMFPLLVDLFKQYRGGLNFIVPVTDALTMKKFMTARCHDNKKEFRADYWTANKLAYESNSRYTNIINKMLLPNGIPCSSINIEADRKGWRHVAWDLDWIIKQPMQHWYGGK